MICEPVRNVLCFPGPPWNGQPGRERRMGLFPPDERLGPPAPQAGGFAKMAPNTGHFSQNLNFDKS